MRKTGTMVLGLVILIPAIRVSINALRVWSVPESMTWVMCSATSASVAVSGTAGSAFHPELAVGPIREVFSKGQYSDGYSGFDGVDARGTTLAEWLGERGIDEVDVVGIATDHCVRATALDAVKA